MRVLCFALTLFLSAVALSASDEKDAVAVLQKTFDGLAARDAAALRATMLPDARLYSIRDENAAAGISLDDFLQRMATAQGSWLERFTAEPKVLIRGRMAQVWGEYEFLRDGKFAHCGVDSASLVKSADGWKIATLVYTAETSGCQGR